MQKNLIATAEITVNATAGKVWKALTDPAMIKQYMFGTTVTSEWKQGSKITWSGEWKGKQYEDKGVILKIIPAQQLQYTHFSPLSGVADEPENYHTVTIELSPENNQTKIILSQDKNATEEERDHSKQNWEMMLGAIKNLVEEGD